jgi:NAD+ synthase (glutamine-hydrolysing)
LVELRKDPIEILEYYRDSKLEKELKLNQGILEYFKSAEDFISDLEKTYKNLNLFFFKRIQAPPIITVSKRAFGFDLREAVLDEYMI